MKSFNVPTIGLALGLGAMACGAVPKPDMKTAELTPATSASTVASTAPTFLPPNANLSIPTKPTSSEDFYANLISCEATANAQVGYIQSLGKRIKSDAITLNQLPCNIVLDIHDNLQRIVDHCAVVVEPSGNYYEVEPTEKLIRQRLSREAAEITEASRQTLKVIEKEEQRCFSQNTTVNHSILL